MFNRFIVIILYFIFWNVHAYTDKTICSPDVNLQICIDGADTNVVSLIIGTYNVNGIHIPSNMTFIIPKNTILKLANDAKMDPKAFGGKANYVLGSIGTKEKMIENVHIILDGEIDGNKSIHTYEKGGVEGIDWKWVNNSTITGKGIVHSVNGDGIDIDATFNSVISNVTVRDNGDSGIHFGSPRPIFGSKNNVVIGVTSINNGYRIGKSGFDLSWPNPRGVAYINCTAIDNYRNFSIEATGGIIYNAKSVNSGKVVEDDDISGADYAVINNLNVTDKAYISVKQIILLKRDIKKLLGMDYHSYLDSIEY